MDFWRTRVCTLILAVALLSAGGLSAFARDHDDARRAVAAGEIRTLIEILNVVKGKLPGEVVGVKLEREAGVWTYEFRVVDETGRLFVIHVNARTGEVERIKEK